MLIGISGKIGSGKDALGLELCKLYPTMEIRKFAEKLKIVCCLLTGRRWEEMITEDGKNTFLPEWGMTIGEMQQRVGTDAIRSNIHPDAWVLALFSTFNPKNDNWVITDMRFPNEAQAVRRHGGILVRVDGSRTGPGNRDPNHISETALDDWNDWDYRFDNSQLNMAQLQYRAQCILEVAARNIPTL